MWFYKVASFYGNPLWMPVESVTLWTKELQARPIAPIVYVIGGTYLCPLFALGFVTLVTFIKELKLVFQGRMKASPIIFLWMLGIPLMAYLFIIRIDNPEHRYFYPILPGIAILAAMNLERINHWLVKYFKSEKLLIAAEWIMMIAYSSWAVQTALPVIFQEKNLMRIPF